MGVFSIVVAKWGIAKALDSALNTATQKLDRRKTRRAIEQVTKNAFYRASKNLPAFQNFTSDTKLIVRITSIVSEYLKSANPEEADKMYSGMISSIVEHAKVAQGEAESFVSAFYKSLDYYVRSNEHLKDQAHQLALYNISVPNRKHFSLRKLQENLPELQKAAANDLDSFEAFLNVPKHQVYLSIEEVKGEKNIELKREDILSDANIGKDILIEAAPGCGKTVCLLQLGQSICKENKTIPFFLPVHELADGTSVCELISKRKAFLRIEQDIVKLACNEGRFSILCDGWNEISGNQDQSRVLSALKQFSREYPNCSLIISSRGNIENTILEGAKKVTLSRLTKEQQESIIREKLVDNQAAINQLNEALETRGLREILEIPFYLSTMVNLNLESELPQSKGEMIQKFINDLTSRDERKAVFMAQLDGEQEEYLKKLSIELTEANSVHISHHKIKKVFSEASNDLKKRGEITKEPSLSDIIKTLVDNHILVQQGTNNEAVYSFQHQQFQEWYASKYVEEMVLTAVEKDSAVTTKLYGQISNYPDWEEAVLFAAEKLSIDKNHRSILAAYTLNLLRSNHYLAAKIISRTRDELWDIVKEEVIEFANNWHKPKENDAALRFMIRTGKAEFADHVWEVIEENEDNGWMLRLNRISYFDQNILGKSAKSKIKAINPKKRASLLYDIISEGSYGAIEFAVNVIKEESDEEIIVKMLDMLDFRAKSNYVKELLDLKESDSLWEKIAENRNIRVAYEQPYKDKLMSAHIRLVENTTDNSLKIFHLNQLNKHGVEGHIQELINLVLEYDRKKGRTNYDILQEILESHSEKLSKAIVDKVISNEQVDHFVFNLINFDIDVDQEKLLSVILDNLENKNFPRQSVRFLTTESLGVLLSNLESIRVELKSIEAKDAKPLRERYWGLIDIIISCSADKLADVINNIGYTEPQQVSDFCEAIIRWKSDDVETVRIPFEGESLNSVCGKIIEWTELLLSHPETDRRDLYKLAIVCGRVGEKRLLTYLKKLLDKELELYRKFKERAEESFAKKQRPDKIDLNEARTIYLSQYRRSFDGFEGSEVDSIVVEYLEIPEFRNEATFILMGNHRSDIVIEKGLGNVYDYSKVREKRDLLSSQTSVTEAHPLVDKLINCIEKLYKEDPSNPKIASMAIAAAQMEYGRRIEPLYNILESTNDNERAIALARILILKGEEIKAKQILPAIVAIEKEVFDENRSSNDNWYRIEEALTILAFTDDPSLISERLGNYKDKAQGSYRLRSIVRALGYSPSDKALDTLKKLQEIFPDLTSERDWYTAVGNINSQDAAEFLVNIICDNNKLESLRREAWFIRDIILRAINSHPSSKQKLIDEIKNVDSARLRQFLSSMSVSHDSIDEELFISIFESIAPDEDDTFRTLLNSISGLATEKVAVDEHTNAYYVAPKDISEIRKILFHHALGSTHLSSKAIIALKRIDDAREDYGFPASEPRHPDIESGKPYPLINITESGSDD